MKRSTPSEMKPVTLSSKPLRKTLTHRSQQGDFVRAFAALDMLSGIYDSIDTLYRTPDPSLTKEGRALRFKSHRDKAIADAKGWANKAVDGLIELEANAVREAEEKAGLHRRLSESEAREIRDAIRALPPKDRDKVIRDAAMNGDSAVIQAVRLSPSPLLVGGATVPENLITTLIEQANPELSELRQEINTAIEFVCGGLKTLAGEIEARRDPILEDRAERQAQATKGAEDSLLGVGNEAAV